MFSLTRQQVFFSFFSFFSLDFGCFVCFIASTADGCVKKMHVLQKDILTVAKKRNVAGKMQQCKKIQLNLNSLTANDYRKTKNTANWHEMCVKNGIEGVNRIVIFGLSGNVNRI